MNDFWCNVCRRNDTALHTPIDHPWLLKGHRLIPKPKVDEMLAEKDAEIGRLRRTLEVEQALAAEDREKYQTEIVRLTNELAECRKNRWHHSSDAPPEHFCDECDFQRKIEEAARACIKGSRVGKWPEYDALRAAIARAKEVTDGS
jgi:hypothetical protein